MPFRLRPLARMAPCASRLVWSDGNSSLDACPKEMGQFRKRQSQLTSRRRRTWEKTYCQSSIPCPALPNMALVRRSTRPYRREVGIPLDPFRRATLPLGRADQATEMGVPDVSCDLIRRDPAAAGSTTSPAGCFCKSRWTWRKVERSPAPCCATASSHCLNASRWLTPL